MRRILFFIFAAALAVPPAASAQQTVNFFLGGFVPRSVEARDPNDVLVGDLFDVQPLDFRVSDFDGFTFGGEWLFPFGRNFEGGLGIGYYTRTVPSVYQNIQNDDGSEIEQDLKLRIVPFTATIRFLPLGNDTGFQPYIGGGVGASWWRYSETGQFVDVPAGNPTCALATPRCTIFSNIYTASGGAVGPLLLGGVRYNFDPILAGFEARYQWAKGNVPANQFLGSKIDLGGFNYLFTIGVRF